MGIPKMPAQADNGSPQNMREDSHQQGLPQWDSHLNGFSFQTVGFDASSGFFGPCTFSQLFRPFAHPCMCSGAPGAPSRRRGATDPNSWAPMRKDSHFILPHMGLPLTQWESHLKWESHLNGFSFQTVGFDASSGFFGPCTFSQLFRPFAHPCMCSGAPAGRPRGDGAPRCMGAHEEGTGTPIDYGIGTPIDYGSPIDSMGVRPMGVRPIDSMGVPFEMGLPFEWVFFSNSGISCFQWVFRPVHFFSAFSPLCASVRVLRCPRGALAATGRHGP